MIDYTKSKEALTAIEKGVADLADSESWTNFLKFQSRFHQYSMRNVMLIAMQYPEASHVAGYNTWKAMDRQVKKGEKGIRILAPVVAKDKVTGDKAIRGFRMVSVFDISQTDGEALPSPPVERLVGSDPDGFLEALTAVGTSLGFSVSLTDALPQEVNGETNHDSKSIRINIDNEPLQHVKTLAHELGHALLHVDRDLDRGHAELEAESVAYVVCSALGIDSGQYSFGYLLTWNETSEETTKALKQSGTRIQKAAHQILDSLVKHHTVDAIEKVA